MPDIRTIATAVLAAAAAAAIGSAADAQTPKSRWLDAQPIVNWNKANGQIPKGPKAMVADIRECEKRGGEDAKKSQPTPETRQVAARGWHGASVEKSAGETVFVFARNGVDGMCRPMAYQIFVFVKGRFAGTLAPRPMDSREDGSGYLEKEGAERFTGSFARYRGSDALCCPSRTSTVTYAIERQADGKARVVPETVVTKATQQ